MFHNCSFVRHESRTAGKRRKGEGGPPRFGKAWHDILCLMPSGKRAGSWCENDDIVVTLERILQQQQHPLFKPLASLWFEARVLPQAWTFPAEESGVSGFAGLAHIFVVGEQPSFNPWPPKDKGRRLLYDSLVACGAAQAHLADIVKSRGKKQEWQGWSPELLRPHIDLLRRELKELQPQRLIFLGDNAQRLFFAHFPKCSLPARTVPHFGALQWVRSENRTSWCQSFREKLSTELKALGGC